MKIRRMKLMKTWIFYMLSSNEFVSGDSGEDTKSAKHIVTIVEKRFESNKVEEDLTNANCMLHQNTFFLSQLK